MDIGYWRLKLRHVVITDIIFYVPVSLSSADMIFDKKLEIFYDSFFENLFGLRIWGIDNDSS